MPLQCAWKAMVESAAVLQPFSKPNPKRADSHIVHQLSHDALPNRDGAKGPIQSFIELIQMIRTYTGIGLIYDKDFTGADACKGMWFQFEISKRVRYCALDNS